MPINKALISHYLATFCLYVALCTGLYYLLFPLYGQMILALSGWALDGFTTVPTQLNTGPDIEGIALSYPDPTMPLVFRFDLFSIGLNFIFAPALVLTTLMPVSPKRAIIGSVIAMLIMLLLHSYHVLALTLHFLTESQNPVLPPESLSPALTTWFHWSYKFADKMGYTLFPFIAWIAVCFSDLVRLFALATGQQHTPTDGINLR